jgi:hypothetical protein
MDYYSSLQVPALTDDSLLLSYPLLLLAKRNSFAHTSSSSKIIMHADSRLID